MDVIPHDSILILVHQHRVIVTEGVGIAKPDRNNASGDGATEAGCSRDVDCRIRSRTGPTAKHHQGECDNSANPALTPPHPPSQTAPLPRCPT